MGNALIRGPVGHDFNLYCDGTASCTNVNVESALSSDVYYSCGGKDSCKGALTNVRCGSGLCAMDFSGEASGDSAKIHVGNAMGFSCTGRYVSCPDNFVPKTCSEPVGGCPGVQTFSSTTCQCECAGNVMGICGRNDLFDWDRCQCIPDGGGPVGGVIGGSIGGSGNTASSGGAYCCLTNEVIFRGECWQNRNEGACSGMNGYFGCYWDSNNCLAAAPTCAFSNAQCKSNRDCCSEHCRLNGECW